MIVAIHSPAPVVRTSHSIVTAFEIAFQKRAGSHAAPGLVGQEPRGMARRGEWWRVQMEESASSMTRVVRHEQPRNLQGEDRARNVRRFSGRVLPNDRLDVREVTQAISATLINTPAKILADATGGSIRAAQNVREGLNAMSLIGFINACRAIPELRALAMEMMGCEAETDPEFVRGLTHLMNAYVRRAQSAPANGDLFEETP